MSYAEALNRRHQQIILTHREGDRMGKWVQGGEYGRPELEPGRERKAQLVAAGGNNASSSVSPLLLHGTGSLGRRGTAASPACRALHPCFPTQGSVSPKVADCSKDAQRVTGIHLDLLKLLCLGTGVWLRQQAGLPHLLHSTPSPVKSD